MVTPASTKTLLDVVTYIQRQFGDESGVQITIADITRWTNQAQMEIINKNPIIQATAVSNSVIGTQTYAYPTDLIEVNSIMFNGNILTPTSFEGIRQELGSDNSNQGTPCYWYTWANLIYLWPVPNVVKQIAVNYSKAPMSVAAIGDLLGVPDRYFDRVCEYVSSKAYELDEDWQAHSTQLQHFEDKLLENTNSDKNMIGSWYVANDSEYL
jgi:hypothetical protein